MVVIEHWSGTLKSMMELKSDSFHRDTIAHLATVNRVFHFLWFLLSLFHENVQFHQLETFNYVFKGLMVSLTPQYKLLVTGAIFFTCSPTTNH